MRILVTGASGFIGSAFCKLALEQGHTVIGLSRSFRRDQGSPGDGTIWITGSIADPPWEAIAKASPTCCVHAAWVTTPGTYEHAPENRDLAKSSLRLLTELAWRGISQFVAIGTCLEYPPSADALREDQGAVDPNTVYARSKHDLREALRRAFASAQVRVTWARLFYPYGRGEHPRRLASAMIQAFARREMFQLQQPRSRKDYVYIDDVATALLMLCESGPHGDINVGTGHGVSLEDFARTIATIMNADDLLTFATGIASNGEDRIADATKLGALGWQPKVGLEEGLRRLVRDAVQ